jgi:hypothetical protein
MCNILSERTEAFCQLVDKGMTGPPKLRRAFWLECRACGDALLSCRIAAL